MSEPPATKVVETEATGTVKYLDADRGFGFISRDDKQPKVFVHIGRVIAAGYDRLEKGQRWRFDIVQSADGKLAADNLRLLA